MYLILNKTINNDRLDDELTQQFGAVMPGWFEMVQTAPADPDAGTPPVYQLAVFVPDGTDPVAVQAVIDAHDQTQLGSREIARKLVEDARAGASSLPDWAIWTAQEAYDNVNAQVFNGMTKAQAEAWIDSNINATTLAGLRTQTIVALKQIAGAVIDLRIICANMAKMVMWLRDLVIRAGV